MVADLRKLVLPRLAQHLSPTYRIGTTSFADVTILYAYDSVVTLRLAGRGPRGALGVDGMQIRKTSSRSRLKRMACSAA